MTLRPMPVQYALNAPLALGHAVRSIGLAAGRCTQISARGFVLHEQAANSDGRLGTKYLQSAYRAVR